jgi:hypothetical protein
LDLQSSIAYNLGYDEWKTERCNSRHFAPDRYGYWYGREAKNQDWERYQYGRKESSVPGISVGDLLQ